MSKYKVIEKATKVTLRGRLSTSGDFTSLFLDWGSGKNRGNEFLDRIYTKPKSTDEKLHNETILKKAKKKLSLKNAELLNDNTTIGKALSNALFLSFYEVAKRLPKQDGGEKAKATIDGYDVAIRKINSLVDLSNVRLKDIDKQFIENLREKLLSSDLEKNTASIYFHCFGAFLRIAVKKGYIDQDPCAKVDPITMESSEVNYIFHEDLIKLKNTKCESEVLKKAALFASQTGLRCVDLKALRWKSIVKTGDLYRIVLKQEKTDVQYIIHFKQDVMDIIGPAGEPEALVFPKFHNNGLTNTRITNWFLRAGIEPRGKPDENFTMHDFRHTFAITLGLNGANLYEISQLLGHSDIGTTERHYARILDQMKQKIVLNMPTL
jgi:integrase/recombinase XerD